MASLGQKRVWIKGIQNEVIHEKDYWIRAKRAEEELRLWATLISFQKINLPEIFQMNLPSESSLFLED